MNYWFNIAIYLCIYGILALSLNVVTGFGGLINMSHAAFFGVGAYTTALAMINWGWGFLPALALAMLATAALSLTMSLPSWRFKGDIFIIATIAVQSMTFSILYNWRSVTNGPYGLSGIPRPDLFGRTLDRPWEMTALALVLALICGLILYLLLKSPWGRLLQAMRQDELAARGVGKNTRLVKLQAMAIACAVAAVAGALYCTYVGFIDPTSFTLDESIFLFSMVLIGGTGNIRGPVVGAVVLLSVRELLRFLSIPDPIAPNIQMMLYGLLLVVVAHTRPQGLAGRYRFQ